VKLFGVAGLVALPGPRVIATSRDSTTAIAPNDDAANYILHDYDVRDVVNTWWASGAEAAGPAELGRSARPGWHAHC